MHLTAFAFVGISEMKIFKWGGPSSPLSHYVSPYFEQLFLFSLALLFFFLVQKCHVRASAPKDSEHRPLKSVRATAERTWGDAGQGVLLLLCSSSKTEMRRHRVESQTPSEAAWLVLLKDGSCREETNIPAESL